MFGCYHEHDCGAWNAPYLAISSCFVAHVDMQSANYAHYTVFPSANDTVA